MQHYLFSNNQLLLTANNAIPDFGAEEGIPFSLDDGVTCTTAVVSEIPDSLHPVGLRASYDLLPLTDYLRAGKAAELLHWHSNHRFCGHCGTPLESKTQLSKWCPKCQTETWPQLSPAIIVLIHRAEEILLVQSRTFKGNYFGLVAGFVEFGESLEECVRREIREETQLEVDNIRYFGSQPWPYPQGLMIGFTARYKSGTLHLQSDELANGGWFNIHNLPSIPKPLSMARKLIDNYITHKERYE